MCPLSVSNFLLQICEYCVPRQIGDNLASPTFCHVSEQCDGSAVWLGKPGRFVAQTEVNREHNIHLVPLCCPGFPRQYRHFLPAVKVCPL